VLLPAFPRPKTWFGFSAKTRSIASSGVKAILFGLVYLKKVMD